MESIREKMQAMEAKATEDAQELTALHAACDDYKAKIEAYEAKAEEDAKALEALAAERQEEAENFESNLQDKDEEIAVLAGEVEELKAKLELTPAANDVSEGQEAVEEGASAGEEVDHEAVLAAMESSAERIAYFREHLAK